jgi:organic radical activating enzyme
VIYPVQIILEASSRCNLSCEGCYRTQGSVSNTDMPFDLFKKIVDTLSWKPLICVTSHGEALMNPQLPQMLDYAASRGHRIDFTTNGTIDRPEVLDTIFQHPKEIHRVIVSLDGLDTRTRMIYRKLSHENAERPLLFIKELLRRKALLPSEDRNQFDIAVSMVQNGQDWEEQEAFIYYWLTEGSADMVLVRRFLSSGAQREAYPKKTLCHFLDGWIATVDASGHMRMCDRYMQTHFIRGGDLNTANLLEVFNGPYLQKYREEYPHEVCTACPQAYSGGGLYGEVVFKSTLFHCFYRMDYFGSIYSKKDIKGGVSWKAPE